MAEKWPEPGHGYTIRERLGGGMWKTAYRASSLYSLSDVALLYFHEGAEIDVVAGEQRNLLLGTGRHSYRDYLARYDGLMKGQDGRWFIVEELLARPLEKLAPVRDLAQFVSFARDLCRGLTCLHEQHAVHRDLKLDNFGLDYRQRCKIFDLGTVTSEGGGIRGTTYTRAPELWPNSAVYKTKGKRRGPAFKRTSDIWGMGAALFALRSGGYPYVYPNEVERRRFLNEQMLGRKIQKRAAETEKAGLDANAAARIRKTGAESKLRERIHEVLRGRSEELLSSMLAFDPDQRSSARYYEAEWSKIADDLGRPVAAHRRPQEMWERLLNQLKAVERHELVFE